MGKYEKINKKKVIQLCNRVQKLEDMQYHYDIHSGEIIPVPNEELDKEERKLLVDAFTMLCGFEEDIRKDFAALSPYSISFNKEEEFIRSAKILLDIYHEELVIERDFSELKIYFKPEFIRQWFDSFIVPRLNSVTWNKKNCARIAYLIFTSKQRNIQKVGTVFSKWHQKLCEMVGGEYTTEYKPNKLNNDLGDIKDTFFIL